MAVNASHWNRGVKIGLIESFDENARYTRKKNRFHIKNLLNDNTKQKKKKNVRMQI